MTLSNEQTGAPERRDGSAVLVAVAWLVVTLPAAWGIYQTGKKAAALFAPPAAHPTTAQAR